MVRPGGWTNRVTRYSLNTMMKDSIRPALTPGPMSGNTIRQNVWKGDAKLSTLLTAPYTFVNGPLASFYGVTGVSGDAFQKVPAEAGTVFLAASEPAIAMAGMIIQKRPMNIATAPVMLKNNVLAESPAKAEPLLPVWDV